MVARWLDGPADYETLSGRPPGVVLEDAGL